MCEEYLACQGNQLCTDNFTFCNKSFRVTASNSILILLLKSDYAIFHIKLLSLIRAKSSKLQLVILCYCPGEPDCL